jgi:hypothetical protein
MQISITPAEQFQKQELTASKFRQIVMEACVHDALTASVAQLSYRGTYSGEQMQAVKDFIDVFLNIAERPQQVKKAPSKTLDYAQLNQRTPKVSQ